jgi:toxin ParE1/3/4
VTVNWTRHALGDLRDIIKYIDIKNPRSALHVKQRIILASHQLQEYPQSGMAVDRPNTRKLVVTGLPYILIYRAFDSYVEIISVIDARMERAPDLQ